MDKQKKKTWGVNMINDSNHVWTEKEKGVICKKSNFINWKRLFWYCIVLIITTTIILMID